MRKKIKPLEKKFILTKYIIGTTSGNKKKWKRIMINGKKTEYEMNKDGIVRDRNTEEIKKPHKIRYYRYSLKLEDGTIANVMRHRLMMALFVPIPRCYREKGYQQENLQVNHIDGIKGHDTLENLEWCTVKENMQHAIDTGLVTYLGENSYMATITDEDAIEICELLAEGKRPKEVSEITGIGEKIIRHIYNNESWKQLTKDYDFPEYEGSKPYMYSDDTIEKACELIQEGKLNNREIGEIIGLDERYISDIKTQKRRTDISSNYDFTNVPSRNAPKAIIAKQVCELLQEGKLSVKQISEITGMTQSMVSGVKNGRYWTDISKDYDFSSEIPNDKHTDPDKINCIKEVCQLLQEGKLTQEKISEKTGISRAVVADIKGGECWKSISKDYTFPDTRKPAEIDENIHKACHLFSKGVSDNAISKEIGITRGFLRKLRRRETRTDISCQYNF